MPPILTKSIRILTGADGVPLLRLRWLQARHFGVLVACILCAIGALIALFVLPAPDLEAAIGMGVMVVVGAVYFLYGLLNSTTLKVASGAVVVRHGPLPWFGDRQLPLAEVAEFSFRQTGRVGTPGGDRNFPVSARAHDGRVVTLLVARSPEAAGAVVAFLDEHYSSPA